MTAISNFRTTTRRLWRERRAQDLIEYALATGFIAVAASAFFPPAIAPLISSIMGRISGLLSQSAAS